MIEPSTEFPVLEEFPRARIPFVIRLSNGSAIIRLIFLIFGPVIRWWRGKIGLQINERILPGLISDIGKYKNRLELEKLLGKPKYVLTGKRFESYPPAGGIMVPDIVEIYLKKRCRIDVHFKDNRLESICGMGQMSPWDSVVGVPWEIEKEKQEKVLRKRLKSLSSTEEREILQKNIDIQTFKLFLQTYLPWDIKIHDDPNILKLYTFIEKTGAYGNLSDLKEVLRRSDKAYKAFSKEMRSYTTVAEFAVRYDFCHPEIREKLSAFFLHPDIIHLIKKYDDLVED